MDMYRIRLNNLRHLIDARFAGVQRQFADSIDRQADYISRCLAGKKKIGESFARYIETTLDLPAGWLDQNRAADSDSRSSTAVSNSEVGDSPAVFLAGVSNMPTGIEIAANQFISKIQKAAKI